MKITSAKDLVDKVLKDIETLTPEEAKTRIEKENAILIDIRDVRELWRDGTIENSKHIPRGMLEFWVDPESPYSKKEISVDKNLILFCAQGMRSALATRS
ncbi:MAG: rhodanese-like domain-containing protein, partial [Candidatus Fonsibacter ubiquis]|nr:rhodanese-like domain-containing protein [Candidatus Fonsibacter ubiquis]